jgi:hypothetical protein
MYYTSKRPTWKVNRPGGKWGEEGASASLKSDDEYPKEDWNTNTCCPQSLQHIAMGRQLPCSASQALR